MRNLFFASTTWAFFVFLFQNTNTRIDWVIEAAYNAGYQELYGDLVLALAAFAVVFTLAAVKDAFKK